MLCFGPDTGPIAIMALPLFEEANRTRAFAVAILRALAERGIASVLPDIPGQGESTVALETLSLFDIQTAYEALVAPFFAERRPCHGIGIRSGALIDTRGLLDARWHLSPQSGAAASRELARIKQSDIGKDRLPTEARWLDGSVPPDARDRPIEVAGNMVSTALLAGLSLEEPFDEPGVPKRVVRLANDLAPADRHVPGAPLWRRNEPANDLVLAQCLADDIADWIAHCER